MSLNKLILEAISEVNERFTINDLTNGFLGLSRNNIVLLSNDTVFLLYDIKSKSPIGYISYYYHKPIDSYTVGGAYAKKGYGAFLYETAMTQVYPNGLSMSRDSNTSDDALNVWRKFNQRNDVKSERMNSDEMTHKKEYWLNDDNFLDREKYKEDVLDLEDTRFYYSYGKDKLKKSIDIGKQYMKDNNISEQDVEYMSWDLE